MVTMQSGQRTSNQQNISALFSNPSFLTSIQGQPQEIIAAPLDRLQDPYMYTLYPSTSEHLKLYKNAMFGIPESDRYDLTKSKWTGFYQ